MTKITWADIEEAIKEEVDTGRFYDAREELPKGNINGKELLWRQREVEDILGLCWHQNGSKNHSNYKATADYHTSPDQHITPGRPLPTICYPIVIPKEPEIIVIASNFSNRTYAQNGKDSEGYEGDENTHLAAMLIMGGFVGPGLNRPWTVTGPTKSQMARAEWMTSWMQGIFNFDWRGVFGHYHFGKEACPGYFMQNYIEQEKDVNGVEPLSDLEWQKHLLRWNEDCLPKYGPDGDWGRESINALTKFQIDMGLRVTKHQDPFTELMITKLYGEESNV